MERTFGLSGDSLSRVLYVSQLTALALAALVVALPLDSVAGTALAVLFASVALATAVGLWRRRTDGDGEPRSGTVGDITYDPFADPGQAARDRWETAIRRLPGGDDERD